MSDLSSETPLFDGIDRLQRQVPSLFGGMPASIRSTRFGAFSQINIGTTDDSIEILAFAPDVEVACVNVAVEKGLLIISGECRSAQADIGADTRNYAQERFTGAFRQAIELPQNADPDKVQARYPQWLSVHERGQA